MTTDNKQEYRKQGRPRKTQELQDETEAEAIASLNTAFRNHTGDVNLRVERIDPYEYRGYCGELLITDGRGISEAEIKAKWGGRIFRLTGRSALGTFVRSATIAIDAPPLRDGQPMEPKLEEKKTDDPSSDLAAAILKSNLTPEEKMKMTAMLTGQNVIQHQQPNADLMAIQQQATIQIFQQMMQSSIDMANAQRQSQMQMMTQTLQLMKQMQEHRDSFDRPPDALRDIKSLMELAGDVQGFSSRLNTGGSVAAEITSALAPLAQNIAEGFFELKGLQASNENLQLQEKINKPLQPRQTADAEQLGQTTGQRFARLSAADKRIAMQAFMQSQQNVANNADNDKIDTESGTSEYVDDEDREILRNAERGNSGNSADQNADVSHREHAAAAEDHSAIDGAGNPPGFPLHPH
jgi:hypothetical protein